MTDTGQRQNQKLVLAAVGGGAFFLGLMVFSLILIHVCGARLAESIREDVGDFESKMGLPLERFQGFDKVNDVGMVDSEFHYGNAIMRRGLFATEVIPSYARSKGWSETDAAYRINLAAISPNPGFFEYAYVLMRDPYFSRPGHMSTAFSYVVFFGAMAGVFLCAAYIWWLVFERVPLLEGLFMSMNSDLPHILRLPDSGHEVPHGKNMPANTRPADVGVPTVSLGVTNVHDIHDTLSKMGRITRFIEKFRQVGAAEDAKEVIDAYTGVIKAQGEQIETILQLQNRINELEDIAKLRPLTFAEKEAEIKARIAISKYEEEKANQDRRNLKPKPAPAPIPAPPVEKLKKAPTRLEQIDAFREEADIEIKGFDELHAKGKLGKVSYDRLRANTERYFEERVEELNKRRR